MSAASVDALNAHFEMGITTVCRCWLITRNDGVSFGFTDHDSAIAFEGHVFEASSGMDASAIQTSSGLSVDNAEAVGALTSDTISEEDIAAGRFDRAKVCQWVVNWQNTDERKIIFQGHVGEISRSESAFEVELRGLSDAFNKPLGRVYMRQCDCQLGDKRCGVDLDQPDYSVIVELTDKNAPDQLVIPNAVLEGLNDLQSGTVIVLEGRNSGMQRKISQVASETRNYKVLLENAFPFLFSEGDTIRLEVGCDKSPKMCKSRFSNFLNYRGFPDIPGEDWTFTRPSGVQ